LALRMSDIRVIVLFMLLCIPSLTAAADDARQLGWGDVSPIFARHCTNCHSSHGAALGLRLDSYEATMAGSVKGIVVLPGNAAKSELVRRLRGESLPRMPFLGYPLHQEQIELIERWVEGGLTESSSR
jgi:predicted CXXCH cytochrome family protein